MKRLLVLSILGALVVATCGSDADAQLFRRWRRNWNYNNGYYSYNNAGNVNRGYRAYSYAPGTAAPTNATPSYTTGVYRPGYVAAGVPDGGNGGYLFNGPNVPPGPAGTNNYNLPFGAGANPQYGAAPGGVGAGFGAGMGPAGSKIGAGTGTIGRP